MAVIFRNARVFCEKTRDFVLGDVWVRDGIIAAVAVKGEDVLPASEQAEVVDAAGACLIPGLVDVHTHGRAGADFTTAQADDLLRMAESYLASGVTTLLPTLASASLEELRDAMVRIEDFRLRMAESYLASGVTTLLPTLASASLEELRDAMVRIEDFRRDGERPGCARFAGIHLEGRYLNPSKRGAHAPHLLTAPDGEEAAELLSLCGGARHISAAVEVSGGTELLKRMTTMGVTVGLGHTAATYAEAMEAIEGGVVSMTHLFNAMPSLHHRDGGAVCAGLVTPHVYCELICDGFHIAPEMVKLAFRMKGDHLTLITDSMEATGCADGEYAIAGMPVIVKDGKARTIDGAIAGSTLSLWEAVKNLQAFAGATLGEAVYAATMAPALQVGIAHEVGSIEVGKRADLLLLTDDGCHIARVMCGGRFA